MTNKLIKCINLFLILSQILYSQISLAQDEYTSASYYGENVEIGIPGEDNRYFLVDGEDINPELLRSNIGYMRSGMQNQISSLIIVDPHLERLFVSHSNLKNSQNIKLPAEFGYLVAYISGYIKGSIAPGIEQKNRLSNLQLAHEIVKASFCFGTDPFMIASKIRRETTFNRTAVSSGSAVGFSQMTGAGIKEVQHQMSGDSDLAVPGARDRFLKGIHCYAGNLNLDFSEETTDQIKQKLKSNVQLDLIFGQILTKTYLSYLKAKNTSDSNLNTYREAFSMYNGDNQIIRGQCMNNKTIELKYEYACDLITFFSRLRRVWHQFLNRDNKNIPI